MLSLGIDTSCYTTSLVVMENRKIVYQGRRVLDVKKGTVGLRQADAFFQHVQNMPILFEELANRLNVKNIGNIVVSNKPRPIENSYMPVFTAGINFAKVISKTLDIPLHYLSHQENHLYAALFESPIDNDFIGVHISGGTSEILYVKQKTRLNIEIVGETLDLSFGKLIDRLGVYMGIDFPCGKEMDEIADNKSFYPLKMSIKNTNFNISGIENQLKQYYDKDQNASKVSYTLFRYIGNLLIELIKNTIVETKCHQIVLSGGVSANIFIRDILKNHFKENIIFTSIEFATDHSIGNAYFGNVVI